MRAYMHIYVRIHAHQRLPHLSSLAYRAGAGAEPMAASLLLGDNVIDAQVKHTRQVEIEPYMSVLFISAPPPLSPFRFHNGCYMCCFMLSYFFSCLHSMQDSNC